MAPGIGQLQDYSGCCGSCVGDGQAGLDRASLARRTALQFNIHPKTRSRREGCHAHLRYRDVFLLKRKEDQRRRGSRSAIRHYPHRANMEDAGRIRGAQAAGATRRDRVRELGTDSSVVQREWDQRGKGRAAALPEEPGRFLRSHDRSG